VLFGALNPRTGALCLDRAQRWDQQSFHEHLRHLRRQWWGWTMVLFLDRGSPHKAKDSQRLARELGIELRWLPVACPELNPVEGLWREVKGQVMANEPAPDLGQSVERARAHLAAMSSQQRLQTAGVLSGNFWLFTWMFPVQQDLPRVLPIAGPERIQLCVVAKPPAALPDMYTGVDGLLSAPRPTLQATFLLV
jgi:hypothetical protein